MGGGRYERGAVRGARANLFYLASGRGSVVKDGERQEQAGAYRLVYNDITVVGCTTTVIQVIFSQSQTVSRLLKQ